MVTNNNCFACTVPLHQQRLNGTQARSFAICCFEGQRICEDCECEFERKVKLPKRAIGLLSPEWKGFNSLKFDNKLKTRVRLAKSPFTEGNFTFTPVGA